MVARVGSCCYGKIPSLSIYLCEVIVWGEPDAWQGILWGGGQEALLSIWATGLFFNSSEYHNIKLEGYCIVYVCFIHSLSHPNLSIFAVSLCCFLRIYEVKGAGDQKSYVDFRMCGSESKVESSWQCCLHILVWLITHCYSLYVRFDKLLCSCILHLSCLSLETWEDCDTNK